MRKHFLILMLLALLPFTAWAADLNEIGATLIAPSYTYGGNHDVKVVVNAVYLHKRGAEPAATDEFYVKGYYKDNGSDALDPNQPVANIANASVGKYWVVVEGVNDYEGELAASFLIDPATLYITIDAVAKTYGQAPVTTQTFKVRSTDTTEGDEVAANIKSDLNISVTVKDGENTITPATTTPVGNYDFAFTFTTTNYTLVRATADNHKYVVSAKSINELTINMVKAASYPYTGENIVCPTFTVKDGQADVAYAVEWFTAAPALNTDANTAVTPKNAGTYYARVTVTNTNYTGSVVVDANEQAYSFEVSRIPLTILVNPQSKTYNAVYYTTNDVQYTIGGLVNNDQGQVNKATLDAKLLVNEVVWVNFKDYRENGYKVDLDALDNTVTIKQGEGNIPLATNYNPITVTYSVWNINKAPLTLTAAPQTINFGNDIPASTVTASTSTELATALANEMTAIAKHFKAPAANGAKNNQYGTQAEIYTPTAKVYEPEADIYEGTTAYTAVLAQDLAAYLNNYVAVPTLVKGSLTVNGGAFTIMPIIASREYNGEALNVTSWSATATVNNNVYQLKANEVSNVAYEYTKLEGTNWVPVTDPTTIVEPGTYRVKVADGVAGATGSSFEAAVVTNPQVQFEILKKKLIMTVRDVTLWNKATINDLQTKGGVNNYDAQMVGTEKISFKYVFRAQEGYTIAENAEHVQAITFTNDVINGAISIEMDADNVADNAHYEFDYEHITYGKLSKITLAELEIDDDAAIKVADAAANSETNAVKYDVTIKGRKLVANDWNVLVLPFAITPYEFCETIGGYAIFNTLKSANATTNTVKFGLEMANLPANEPFLVKPLAEVDFDEMNDNETPETDEDDFRQYVFANKNIVSGDPIKDDVDGVKFIGTYKDTKVLVAGSDPTAEWAYVEDGGEAGKKIMFLATPQNGKAAWYTATAGTTPDKSYNLFTLGTTKAYLDFNGTNLSAPLITVEEIDGSVTAISSITNEGVAVKAEGWYTIDGIRLQGAPSKKGIYINNGKKVVLK